MKDENFFLNIGNAFSRLVLQSPAHRLLSEKSLLITFSGRSTGEKVSIPVEYVESNGEILLFSSRERSWWKNLRKGSPVTITLQGRNYDTWAEVIEDPEKVVSFFVDILRSSPKTAKNAGFEDIEHISSYSRNFQTISSKYIIIRIKL